MKSLKLIVLSVLLMVLAAFSVSAASLSFSSTSDLIIGSPNQDRESVSKSIIVNYDATAGAATCTVDVTTLPISNDATSQSATGYVTYEAASVTRAATISVVLQPGANTVSVIANIPDDFDAVDSVTLNEKAFDTFDIRVTPNSACATAGTVTTITLGTTIQAVNRLLIDNVEVCTAEGCDDADDGDDVEDLSPGDELTVTATVENDYSDSDDTGEKIKDVDFKDVQLEIEIDDDDIDFDDDDDFDLDANDEQTSSFKFDIDLDAQDGSVDMILRVFGTDDNGALHGEEIRIDLEIDRNSHDLVFTAASARPTTLSCAPRTATISYTLRNQGTSDEDDVRVTLSAPELNVQEEKLHDELDEDRTRTGSFILTLPETVAEGVYSLVLGSFYDVDSLSNEKTVQVTVQACGTEAMEEEEAMEEQEPVQPIVVQPPVQPVVIQPRAPATTSTPEEESSNSWYLIGVILAIVVVLVIIIVLIMTLVRGRGGENLE
ncbi:DUF3827 domain-containing protein [Candidatus Woesearchaeota archaeon]|nr:DUF3827 domain-containing protein [Candidatus Woesearchaeota archaeon]